MSSTTMNSEPVLQLTENAANQVRHLIAQEEEPEGKALRVFVEKGGCSGLQYSMIFDIRRDDDLVSEFFGVPVVVDTFSAQFVKGTLVDFSDALTGGGFKISNPNAKQTCGCGKSFEA